MWVGSDSVRGEEEDKVGGAKGCGGDGGVGGIEVLSIGVLYAFKYKVPKAPCGLYHVVSKDVVSVFEFTAGILDAFAFGWVLPGVFNGEVFGGRSIVGVSEEYCVAVAYVGCEDFDGVNVDDGSGAAISGVREEFEEFLVKEEEGVCDCLWGWAVGNDIVSEEFEKIIGGVVCNGRSHMTIEDGK